MPAHPTVTLAITGARELSPAHGQALRPLLMPRLLTLLGSAPDAKLTFTFTSGQDGTVSAVVEAATQHLTDPDQLCTAVARALHPALATQPTTLPSIELDLQSTWSLAPIHRDDDQRSEAAQLEAIHTMISGSLLISTGNEALEVLARHPGTTLGMRFHPHELRAGETLPRFSTCIFTSTSPGRPPELPLEVRVLLNRMVPGHHIEPGLYSLTLRYHQVADLPLIPISMGGPVPGLPVAPAATVPVRYHSTPPVPGQGVHLGSSTTAAGTTVQAGLTDEERVRHVHITGRTGTGKSSLLAAIAHSVATSGQGMLVLDPHGELVERIATELPTTALERTVLIQAGELTRPVPLNPLASTDPVVQDLAIADILAAFYTIFDPTHSGIVGPRFEQVVGMSLRTLIAHQGTSASLLDVPRLLTDRRFQYRARAALTDPAVIAFWSTMDSAGDNNDHAELISWITAKWERFTTTAALRAILGSGQDTLDMAEAMDASKIMLLDLSKAAIGAPAAELLGFLYTTRAWTAALKRGTPTPFTIMVDEAHSFMAGALPTMLSEGRKFGLSVILAHQYLSQLPTELSASLAGNTATQIAFRAGRADAEHLSRRMGSTEPAESFTTLPDLTALIQRTTGPTTAHPHTLRISHHARLTGDQATERIKDLTLRTTTRYGATPAPRPQTNTPPEPHHTTAPELQNRPRTTASPQEASSFLDDWLSMRADKATDHD